MEEPLAPSPCPYGCAAQLAVGPLPLLAFAGTRCFLYNNRLPRPSSQPCPPSDKTNKQDAQNFYFPFYFSIIGGQSGCTLFRSQWLSHGAAGRLTAVRFQLMRRLHYFPSFSIPVRGRRAGSLGNPWGLWLCFSGDKLVGAENKRHLLRNGGLFLSFCLCDPATIR
jgi:hypothetical protein